MVHFIYEDWLNADDLLLLSPTVSGLQSLLDICGQFAEDNYCHLWSLDVPRKCVNLVNSAWWCVI